VDRNADGPKFNFAEQRAQGNIMQGEEQVQYNNAGGHAAVNAIFHVAAAQHGADGRNSPPVEAEVRHMHQEKDIHVLKRLKELFRDGRGKTESNRTRGYDVYNDVLFTHNAELGYDTKTKMHGLYINDERIPDERVLKEISRMISKVSESLHQLPRANDDRGAKPILAQPKVDNADAKPIILVQPKVGDDAGKPPISPQPKGVARKPVELPIKVEPLKPAKANDDGGAKPILAQPKVEDDAGKPPISPQPERVARKPVELPIKVELGKQDNFKVVKEDANEVAENERGVIYQDDQGNASVAYGVAEIEKLLVYDFERDKKSIKAKVLSTYTLSLDLATQRQFEENLALALKVCRNQGLSIIVPILVEQAIGDPAVKQNMWKLIIAAFDKPEGNAVVALVDPMFYSDPKANKASQQVDDLNVEYRDVDATKALLINQLRHVLITAKIPAQLVIANVGQMTMDWWKESGPILIKNAQDLLAGKIINQQILDQVDIVRQEQLALCKIIDKGFPGLQTSPIEANAKVSAKASPDQDLAPPAQAQAIQVTESQKALMFKYAHEDNWVEMEKLHRAGVPFNIKHPYHNATLVHQAIYTGGRQPQPRGVWGWYHTSARVLAGLLPKLQEYGQLSDILNTRITLISQPSQWVKHYDNIVLLLEDKRFLGKTPLEMMEYWHRLAQPSIAEVRGGTAAPNYLGIIRWLNICVSEIDTGLDLLRKYSKIAQEVRLPRPLPAPLVPIAAAEAPPPLKAEHLNNPAIFYILVAHASLAQPALRQIPKPGEKYLEQGNAAAKPFPVLRFPEESIVSNRDGDQYLYYIQDGMTLLQEMRQRKLTHNDAQPIPGGEPHSVYRENNERCFVGRVYDSDHFSDYLRDDVGVLLGDDPRYRAWQQKPKRLILATLRGLHWRDVVIDIDYERNQVNVLWDDPFGQPHFPEPLRAEYRQAIQTHIPRLMGKNSGQIRITEHDKAFDQQGVGRNSWNCGPITFQNTRDYITLLDTPLSVFAQSDRHYTVKRVIQGDSNLSEIRRLDKQCYRSIQGSEIISAVELTQNFEKSIIQRWQTVKTEGVSPTLQKKIAALSPKLLGLLFTVLENHRLLNPSEASYTQEELERACEYIGVSKEQVAGEEEEKVPEVQIAKKVGLSISGTKASRVEESRAQASLAQVGSAQTPAFDAAKMIVKDPVKDSSIPGSGNVKNKAKIFERLN